MPVETDLKFFFKLKKCTFLTTSETDENAFHFDNLNKVTAKNSDFQVFLPFRFV